MITGVQKLILFNPDQTKYLYKSKINPGKSEVNFWDYGPQVYPEFSKSNYVEIIVEKIKWFIFLMVGGGLPNQLLIL